jgi:hypothetical protein
MKRILTNIVNFHWLVFFTFHALGSLAGSLTFQSLSGRDSLVASLGSNGPMRSFPLINAGLGTASLLVAVLFFWACANNLFGRDLDVQDGEVDKIAYGGGALVLSAMSAIALIEADPAMLLAATAYFIALFISWAVTRLEYDVVLKQMEARKQRLPGMAKVMAIAAAHPHKLAHIAVRERK